MLYLFKFLLNDSQYKLSLMVLSELKYFACTFDFWLLVYVFPEVVSWLLVFPEAYVLVIGFLEPGVSLEAVSLSTGIEVRLAYILPSPDPINSCAIGGIILGMVVVI
ncbi:hypothetical protein Hanom_Chr15g01385141 [Helianthus anomalus]